MNSARKHAPESNQATHQSIARLPSEAALDKRFLWMQRCYYGLILVGIPVLLGAAGAGLSEATPWFTYGAGLLLMAALLSLNFTLYHSDQAVSRTRKLLDSHVTGFINRSQQKIRYLTGQLSEESRERKEIEQKLLHIESDARLHLNERTRQLSETNELLNQQIKLRQNISDALARSQTRLSQAIEASNLGLWDWDLVSQTLYQSPFEGIFTQREMSSRDYLHQLKRLVHPEDYAEVQAAIGDYINHQSEQFKMCYRVYHVESNQWYWIEDQGKAVNRNGAGHVLRMLGTRRNITEERHRQEQLQLTQSVYDQTSEGIFVLNHRFQVVSVNQAFRRIIGYDESELLGKNWLDISHTPQKNKVFKQARIKLAESGYWEAELFEKNKAGQYFPMRVQVNTIQVKSSGANYFAGLVSDQTSHKEADEKLRYLLNYDDLTGLANRTLFKDRMHSALVRARNGVARFALLCVDIDRFKHINQNLGHEHADTLLKHFASRLSFAMNQADTVARLGDDEFAIILPGINRDDVGLAARQILREVTKPYHIDHQELLIAASIGITLFPSDGREIPQLLKQASIAVRQAKYLGGNNYQFYSRELKDISKFRISVESDLRKALRQGELEVYYQPKLALATQRIESVEALVRWNHPNRGMIHPSDFVNIAEESGLISDIGVNVMTAACKQAKLWLDAGLGAISVAINLSAYQLRQDNVVAQVQNILQETQLPPELVELELTESAIIENVQASAALLQRFSAMGIRLSVDDFGTGYSSFSYLRRLPVSSLKIDRSFVRDVDASEEDAAICQAIIALAQTLKLKVVAEGVENKAQLQFLQKARCDLVQGYYLSKPLNHQQMTELLKKQITTQQPLIQ